MASYQTLSSELQCSLCKGLLTASKFVGQCHHSACLKCLEKLVAAKRLSSFPCPVCKKKCTIPPKGVAELNDDSRLQAIVEKYQKMKVNKSIVRCTVCSNHPASHFCEECDKINLCIPCSKKHNQDPLTAAHELVGICNTHGKKLAMYCRKCGTAICSACRIADHPSGSQEHDLVPHQKVSDEGVAQVVAAVDKLDRIRKQKENALFNLITVRESIVGTINSDLAELGHQSDSAIKLVRKKQADLKAEKHGIENQICNLKEQIETLMKRKDTVKKEIVLVRVKKASLRKKKDEFSKYLNQYREACTMKFKDVVIQAVAETEEIKAKVNQGREETSSKRVLDDQTVPSLVKVREELTKAFTAAQQVDRVAPFVGVKERMARFIPNSAPMEIGFIQKEFSKLTKFADISFPADRPCRFLCRPRHLADGRLASLYKSDDANECADTISLHDSASPAIPQIMIDKNIYPAIDMTVTAKGELMVLRWAKPVVRVFNAHNGDFRDINISVGKNEMDWVRSIETDEEGNIFVLDTDGHLRLFKPDGVFIKEAMVSFSIWWCEMMSYCIFKRILYIANGEKILRYLWDGTVLKEMASLAHDVDGFICTDICTGYVGEVFVVGKMRDTLAIRIYQVVVNEPIKQKEHAASSTDEKELCGSDLGARKDKESLCGSDPGARKDEEALCGSDPGAGKDEEALCGSDPGAGKDDKALCGSDLGAGKDKEALCGGDPGVGKDEEALCGSDLGPGKDEEALCGSDLGAGQDEEALCGSDIGAGKDEEALCGSDPGAGKDDEALCGSDLGAGKDEEAPCGSDLGAWKDEEALCASDPGVGKDEEALCGSDPGAWKVDDRIEIHMIRLNFDDGNADRRSDWYPFITVFGNTLALGNDDEIELFHLSL